MDNRLTHRDWPLDIELVNNDGTLEDLTGATVKYGFKEKDSDEWPIADAFPLVGEGYNGGVRVMVPKSITAQIKEGNYTEEFQITAANGEVFDGYQFDFSVTEAIVK